MPVRNDTRHLEVKHMNISQISWLAGIIEGEGYFAAKQYKRGKSFRLNVKMADPDIIKRLQDITGVGTIKFRGSKNVKHKDQWDWQVGNCKQVLHILCSITPLLGERRRAMVDSFITLALEFIQSHKTCVHGHDKTNNSYANGTCKTCVKTKDQRRREEHPAEIAAYQKNYRLQQKRIRAGEAKSYATV